jgi:hypothetical protein
MDPELRTASVPPPAAPVTPSPDRQLIAPLWHTVVLLILFLGVSYLGALGSQNASEAAPPERGLIIQYAGTIGFEFFLLLLVWVGLRLRGKKLRDLIGGRWPTVEDFLLDLAIAVGFVIAAVIVLASIGQVLGMRTQSQISEAKKLANMLGPQSGLSMAMFVLLSCTAGFVEEILFRGYLQRQITALSGNAYVGVVGSAIFFGAGHGYEGARRMVLIAVLGLMFGLLTLLRKSLRPGMMAHAFFDSLQGALLWSVRKGAFPMS